MDKKRLNKIKNAWYQVLLFGGLLKIRSNEIEPFYLVRIHDKEMEKREKEN